MRYIAFALCFAILGALQPSARPANAAASDAVSVVESFHEDLISVMKEAESLGFRGRYDRLAGTIDDAFALPAMVHIAIGSYWKEATDPQKQALVDVFRRLSITTYAERFNGYSGESFETMGNQEGPQNTQIVQTQLVRPNDSPVALSYVMREVQGRWQVIDVLLQNSVSELAVRRSEYRRVLAKDGVDGLIHILQAKADQLAQLK